VEHVEDILFNAERALQRRYPSRAKQIAAATKELWHRDGVGCFYCGVIMAKATGLQADDVTPFYVMAERDAEYAEAARQQAAHDRLRRRVFFVWGLVVAAGIWLAALYL